MTQYVFGWCSPGQAHFWERETPNHDGCPGQLGTMTCACPHHDGVSYEEADRLNAPRRPRAKRRRLVRTPWLV